MKTSICIDMMFADTPFMDKFKVVKDCGFNTIEFWKWTNKDVDAVVNALKTNDMNLSIFNIDSTDEQLSYDLSRGILNAGRVDDFLKAVKESVPVYKKFGACAMIVLIGEHADYNKENIKKCLISAIPILEENDMTIIIEPLNNIDRVGYCMPYATPIFELLREINNPHIKMLYDIYHQNMMGDFDMEEIKENIDLIGHFHVADAPGRHQVGTGNVDYKTIINEILKLDYSGHIGLEYRPTVPDEQTLDFFKEF